MILPLPAAQERSPKAARTGVRSVFFDELPTLGYTLADQDFLHDLLDFFNALIFAKSG